MIDVAPSWILPPFGLSPDDKQKFVVDVLQKYAYYHNNFDLIRGKYRREVLQILWDNNLKFEAPVHGPATTKAFGLPVTATLLNSNHSAVARELGKNYVGFNYHAHGSPHMIGIGLNYYKKSPLSYGAIYTDRKEYIDFSRSFKETTPFLFVKPFACKSIKVDIQDNLGGWPQVMMALGTWAYGDVSRVTKKSIGHNIINKARTQWFLFGDVMAHF